MSAAVSAVPVPAQSTDPSAARKRRREILASQRCPAPETTSGAALATPVTSDDEAGPVRKSRRVSDFAEEEVGAEEVFSALPAATSAAMARPATSSNTKKKSTAKKPQLKYDPDVPMTKEEAAVWRREQRRKRNRESAALSRQRQRDRIADLEVEVAEWKTKVESVMERIKKLEEASGIDSQVLVPVVALEASMADIPTELEVLTSSDVTSLNPSKFVSPPVSPGHSPFVPSPSSFVEASPVASSLKTVVDAVVDQVLGSGEFEHSDKMISRHAVKIPDAPTLPLLPKSSDSTTSLPTPEACLSGDAAATDVPIDGQNSNSNPLVTTKLAPIDSSLFPVKREDELPSLLTDEENEDEFGEFLLDAVQWL
mmetsp:Transcript_2099/g.3861  ORF Transcript_2099/g.3861 Transcript_2099/m.3861 type:complete len:369 (+) Transcript_2099:132-1238(+)